MDKADEAAATLYNLFAEQSDENGVWRGKLIETAQSVGISQSLYQRAMSRLKANSSIETIRGAEFTEVHLLGLKIGGPKDLTESRRYGSLGRRVAAIEQGGTRVAEELSKINVKLDNIEMLLKLRRDTNEQHDGS